MRFRPRLGHGKDGAIFLYNSAYKMMWKDSEWHAGKDMYGIFRFLVGGPIGLLTFPVVYQNPRPIKDLRPFCFPSLPKFSHWHPLIAGVLFDRMGYRDTPVFRCP